MVHKNENSLINNPATGLAKFGNFPEIKERDGKILFSSGDIYLRYGIHTSSHRGFGFAHIWQERFPGCLTFEEAEPKVLGLVCGILVNRAAIHYEYNAMREVGKRPTIFKSSKGSVVVEERLDGLNNVFYSIVTAYKGWNARGSLVGSFRT